MKRLLIMVLSTGCLLAQETSTDGDKFVTVQKKYVSSEGLKNQQSIPGEASQWVGFGKEIGLATKEGLNAVVDVSEKFGTTNVGRFVMFMVAWKIFGHDILRVILGVPIFFVLIAIWWHCMKRFFFGYRILVKKDGRVREYAEGKPFDFGGGDARVAAGIVHTIAVAVLLIGLFVVVFT